MVGIDSYVIKGLEHFASEAGISFDDKRAQYLVNIINSGTLKYYSIEGKGFIAWVESPMIINPFKILASEIAWFVEKEYRGSTVGIKLLKEYEKIAKNNGCNFVDIAYLEHMQEYDMENMYSRMGYKKYETHFIKEV